MMSLVYDGHVIDLLPKEFVLEHIKDEAKKRFLTEEEAMQWAMEEAFRVGFLRGEEYGRGK